MQLLRMHLKIPTIRAAKHRTLVPATALHRQGYRELQGPHRVGCEHLPRTVAQQA